MKQWIREHPWRLEIVPAVLSLLTIALVWLSRDWETTPPDQAFGLTVTAGQAQAWLTCLVVGLWTMGLLRNHQWAVMERDKSFNYASILWIVLMGVAGCFASQWRHAELWVAIILVSAGAQALLEWGRRSIPIPAVEENPFMANAGEPFYYRERSGYLADKVAGDAAGLFFIVLPSCWLLGWRFAGAAASIGVPSLILLALLSRPVFVLTNDKVEARFGLLRRSISIAEVKDCGLSEFQPLHFMEYLKCKALLWAPTAGTNLRLDTVDGTSYLLGLRDPETACALINAAIAARQKEAKA